MTLSSARPDQDPAGVVLHWSAIWRAALSVATIAVPLALVQQWLLETDRIERSDPVNLLLFLGILLAGALGGFGAAKGAVDRPLPNGAAAAALAYAGVQGVGIVRRLIIGEELSSPLAWVYLMLLMATCGMFGAWLENRSKPLREGRGAIDSEEAECPS